jgi:hypothetical protein
MLSPHGRWRCYPFASALVVCAASAQAQAPNQSQVYETGRQLYANGEHQKAADHFQKQIEGTPAGLTEPPLVQKGRMIWGASLMWLGRKADAILQFEKILGENSKFAPDPVAFPQGVLAEFEATRTRLASAAITNSNASKLKKELDIAHLEITKLKSQVEALKSYSREERLVSKHSRIVASIPFGAGQFQNGDTALGLIFLGAQTLALGTAVTTFAIHQNIPSTPDDPAKAASAESTSRYLNWAGSGAFLVFALAGIIHANLTFVPESYEVRSRPLPPGLGRVQPLFAISQNGGFLGISAAF